MTRHQEVLSNEKIRFKERFSFGLGSMASNIVFAAVSNFIAFYYTDIIGISAAAVGTLLVVSRIFDGFSDFGDFGDIRYRYDNSKLIRNFFLNDSFVGLDTLIYEFNRHALENEKEKNKKRDEESLKYQRANREKINQYLRDKPKASQRKDKKWKTK